MIRVLIVEDQTMLRESLAYAIDSQPDMQVVAHIADAAQCEREIERHSPDLLLMDVCTENDSSGIAAAAKAKEEHPDIKTVIMTGMPEITFTNQARDADVDSFIYKNVGTEELLSVLRSTMKGYSTFPAEQHGNVFGAIKLTDEEVAILRLVCETKTRKEIATELYLSEGTVKRRISEILAKTGYDSILKLAVRAVSDGYIVPRMNGES